MFNQYPYTDFHEMNLDWLIKQIRQLEIDFDEFKVTNSIRFYGQWDVTRSYPEWSLVSVDNIGYISVKPVPAGVDIENGDYWKAVADYSALIANMQERIVQLENDVDALDESVRRINNKKYLFLGDSYYLGGTGVLYSGIGWASQVISFMNLTPDEYILTPAEDVVSGGSVSLPAFYPSEGTHKSFKTILELTSNRYTQEQRDEVTDIVVAGGYNDINKGDAIITGIRDYAAFAHSAFPNAKLWVAHIGYSTSNTHRVELMDTRIKYRLASAFDMAYISDAEFVLNDDDYFISDGVHPTESGYKAIGRAIANVLNGGNHSYTPATRTKVSTFELGTLYAGGLVVNKTSQNTLIGSPEGLTITGLNNVVSKANPLVIPFDNSAAQPSGGLYIPIKIDLHNSAGDHWTDCILGISQSGSTKRVVIFPVDPTINYTGVNSIMVPPFNMVYPPEYL